MARGYDDPNDLPGLPELDNKRALDVIQDNIGEYLTGDSSHDVNEGVQRINVRFVIDCEIEWVEPPRSIPTAVISMCRSYLLKALAAHKYVNFTGVTVRAIQTDDE